MGRNKVTYPVGTFKFNTQTNNGIFKIWLDQLDIFEDRKVTIHMHGGNELNGPNGPFWEDYCAHDTRRGVIRINKNAKDNSERFYIRASLACDVVTVYFPSGRITLLGMPNYW